jgi:hypothetical protein
MTDPRSVVRVCVGGEEYRLHMGMSVLAELQQEHGDDVLSRLDSDNVPVKVIADLIALALGRYHADVSGDKYLVDDIVAEHPDVFARLMVAFAGDPGEGQRGNEPRRPKAKAKAA